MTARRAFPGSPFAWIALLWLGLACRTLGPLPAVPAPPASQAPATAINPPEATAPAWALPTATPSLAPGPDWQPAEAAGVLLHYPPTWERLASASDPVFPEAALRLAERQGAAQFGAWCLSSLEFSQAFGGPATSPSAAGEVMWERLARSYEAAGLADRLAAERLAELTLAGQPAIQVYFSAPGLPQPIGLENPLELADHGAQAAGQPETVYAKSLTLLMAADRLCYFVVTAVTEAAREQPEIAAIMDSLRLTP